MIQDVFKRMINEIYTEYFKPNGWKKQGSNYRLFDGSGIGKIINFQKSKWSNAANVEFFINHGVYMEADTCKLLSDMGYYEEIYEYVRSRGGQYFDSLAEEIKMKMKT